VPQPAHPRGLRSGAPRRRRQQRHPRGGRPQPHHRLITPGSSSPRAKGNPPAAPSIEAAANRPVQVHASELERMRLTPPCKARTSHSPSTKPVATRHGPCRRDARSLSQWFQRRARARQRAEPRRHVGGRHGRRVRPMHEHRGSAHARTSNAASAWVSPLTATSMRWRPG
jgi:hypothetical protein